MSFPQVGRGAALLLIVLLVPAARGGPPTGTDLYGDPLPEGAVARMGSARFRQSPILGVAFLPDGKRLVSCGARRVVLWDAGTGVALRRFGDPGVPAESTAVSGDGRQVAAGLAGGLVCVWQVETGREVCRFGGGGGGAARVALAPDGKRLAWADGRGAVHVTDLATGTEERSWTAAEPVPGRRGALGVNALTFAPRGEVLASVATYDRAVRLWDPATGQEVRRLELPHSGTVWLAFAPDGGVLASAGPDRTRLWDPRTGKLLRELQGAAGPSAVAFSADGKVLATGEHATQLGAAAAIRLWDPESGVCRRRLLGCGGSTRCLAFSRDGRTLAAGGSDNRLRLYDVDTGAERHPPPGHTGAVARLAVSPDGATLASAGSEAKVLLWDAATGRRRRELPGMPFPSGLYFGPAGRDLLAGGGPDGVRGWDAQTGQESRRLSVPLRVEAWVPAPDAREVRLLGHSGSFGDASFGLADLADGRPLRRWRCQGAAHGALLSPDGRLAVTVGLGPDRRWAAALWEFATGQRRCTLAGVSWPGAAFAFSSDGRLVASANGQVTESRNRGVNLWDATTGGLVRTLGEADDFSFSVAFSPDGSLLAAAGNLRGRPGEQVVRVWDIATGAERRRWLGHEAAGMALAFFPDNRRLASGSPSGELLVWDLGSDPPPAAPSRPRRALTAARLASAWDDLAGDAGSAHAAVWALADDADKAVPFLAQRVRPAPVPDANLVARLVADLDDDAFATRERATHALEAAGEAAEPALRRALGATPSAEVRRRIETLLHKPRWPVTAPEELQALRAVEALEHAGTPEARRLLEGLAGGTAEARLTREAKASLARLGRT